MSRKQTRSAAPEYLADFLFICSSSLINADIDEETAVAIANKIAEQMCKNWGKQLIYFPEYDSLSRLERNAKIFAECNGLNHAELAKKYQTAQEPRHPRRQRLGGEVRPHGTGAGLHLCQVRPDSRPLGRERRRETVHEPVLPGRQVELPVAQVQNDTPSSSRHAPSDSLGRFTIRDRELPVGMAGPILAPKA